MIVIPYLGVFIYLIARGSKMQEHAVKDAAGAEAATAAVRPERGRRRASPADEIARLADLKAKGAITDAEFQAGKAKALGS